MKESAEKLNVRAGILPSTNRGMPSVPRQAAVSKLPWKFLLLFTSCLLILTSLMPILSNLRLHDGWTTMVTALFAVWFLMYLVSTYKYYRTIYLFATAYVIALAVFHLGHIISDSIGWFDVVYLNNGDMAPWQERAGWYILLAFGCYGAGLAVSFKNHTPVMKPPEATPQQVEKNLNSVYWIGVGLLLASIAALFLLMGSVGNILRFSRAEIFAGVGDTRGFGFFLLVAPSAMVLMVTSARTKLQKRYAYTIATTTLLFILFLGYRSSALFPTLVGVIIWVKTGRRIPLPVALAMVLVVLIAIPTVSTLRSLGAYQDLSKDDLAQSLEQSEVEDVFVQLGGVNTVIAHVIKWVPAEDPYRYGQSYLLALRNAIPNIGLNIGQSGRSKAFDNTLLDEENIRLMNPGDWYTFKTSRYMFSIGGGSGFSTIAEAYLNFGTAGVVVYFMLLGYLLGRLDQVDLLSSPKLMVFSGAMLWPLLKSVRNAFGVFLKPVVFILVCIMIWKAISIWKSRSR